MWKHSHIRDKGQIIFWPYWSLSCSAINSRWKRQYWFQRCPRISREEWCPRTARWPWWHWTDGVSRITGFPRTKGLQRNDRVPRTTRWPGKLKVTVPQKLQLHLYQLQEIRWMPVLYLPNRCSSWEEIVDASITFWQKL